MNNKQTDQKQTNKQTNKNPNKTKNQQTFQKSRLSIKEPVMECYIAMVTKQRKHPICHHYFNKKQFTEKI
jgi:hypothetical protein